MVSVGGRHVEVEHVEIEAPREGGRLHAREKAQAEWEIGGRSPSRRSVGRVPGRSYSRDRDRERGSRCGKSLFAGNELCCVVMCLSRKSISFAILALTAGRAASRSLFIGGGQRGLRFGGRLLCLSG